MQVSNPNNVKIYNLSAGKSMPEWLSDRKKRALQKTDIEVRRRIQLIQDFEMPTVSNCISMSNDNQYIFATGVYKPRVRCFDVSQMSLKFERCMDSEVIKFRLLSDDYTKIAFLQNDRHVEFHNQNGRYYRTRIPMYGRDFSYHEASTELYFVGASSEVSRLNLELGKFMMPMKSDTGDCEINCCDINSAHDLFICGTSLGHVACFDPRTRNRISLLDCTSYAIADNPDIHSLPSITTVKFKDHLQMAVGTSTGQILLYDLRSSRPFLVKDHNFCLPIKKIEFHQKQNLVLSIDSRILKLWDINTGKAFTSIEPMDTKLNDLYVVRDTGMLFLANEAPKILTYYIPTLGPAPKWCSFLDSITEELEENSASTVYDDYKFVTRSELEGLGMAHLIGTEFIRAYMHGFFLDIRLYHKAKSIAEPFAYEEYRKKRLQEKIQSKAGSRVKVKSLPKVNRNLAEKLHEEENEEKKKKKNPSAALLLHDERFQRLFTDTDFQIDEQCEEYQRINPVVSKRKINKRKEQEEIAEEQFESSVPEKGSDESSSSEEEEVEVKPKKLRKPRERKKEIVVAKKKISRKTVGDLIGEVGYSDVVREAGSTFGNLEMTFNLNQNKSETRRDEQNRVHRAERKSIRRSAGKLAAPKPTPRFYMGQRIK